MFDTPQLRLPLIWSEPEIQTPETPGSRTNNYKLHRSPKKSGFNFIRKIQEVEEQRHVEFPITIELQPMKKIPYYRSVSLSNTKRP